MRMLLLYAMMPSSDYAMLMILVRFCCLRYLRGAHALRFHAAAAPPLRRLISVIAFICPLFHVAIFSRAMSLPLYAL